MLGTQIAPMNHKVNKMKLFDVSHMLTSFAGSGIGIREMEKNVVYMKVRRTYA